MCDYAIVPIGGYPVTVTVTDVLTNAWLVSWLLWTLLLVLRIGNFVRFMRYLKQCFVYISYHMCFGCSC